MGIPICGACRRPIEERVVTALGKHWHVEVCITVLLKMGVFFYFCFIFFSILYVPNVKNHSWVIVIMRNVAWRIAKLIIISYLAIYALYAIKL